MIQQEKISHRKSIIRSLSKHIKMVAITIVGLSLFMSCSQDDSGGITKEVNDEIKFAIGLNSGTRLVMDADFKSEFEIGNTIGVYAVQHSSGVGGTLQPAGNFIHNQKLTYEGEGVWKFDAPIYFPSNGDELDFFLYYPYSANHNNPTDITIETAKDQTTPEVFNESYFATGSVKNVTKSQSAISLNLTHRLSLIQSTVSGTGLGARVNRLLKVYLVDAVLKGSFDLATQDFSGFDITKDNILLHRVEDNEDFSSYTYRALIIPQAFVNNSELFIFERGGKLTYDIFEDITLPSATVTKFNITLQPPAGNKFSMYDHGDIYPRFGLAEGVVFKAYQISKYLTMFVGLDEGYTTWSTETIKTGAIDQVRGLGNMNKIKVKNNTFEKYPAFKWCNDQSGQLPAKAELVFVYDLYDVDRDFFNKQFVKAGGIPLADDWYWISSEVNLEPYNEADAIHYGNKRFMTTSKTNKCLVRLVKTII